ncbi:MAG: hypothetical protein R3F20_02130 [Planctomycetota bacterium]
MNEPLRRRELTLPQKYAIVFGCVFLALACGCGGCTYIMANLKMMT